MLGQGDFLNFDEKNKIKVFANLIKFFNPCIDYVNLFIF